MSEFVKVSALNRRGFTSRQQSHLIALEPRMMFDGAAVATSVELALDATRSDALTLSKPLFLAHEFTDSDYNANLDRGGMPFGVEAAALEVAFGPDETGVVASASTSDIIFIDTSVTGYQNLASEWVGRGTIVLIDRESDGIDQIRTALAGRSDIGAIHIVSHGAEGVFWLGTTRIDQAAVAGELASSFAAIGAKLSADGDILIYGCDVGAGAAGQGLIDLIAVTSGADVAASIDDTGAILRGGDWTLENRLGVIDATSLVAERWEGLLATALISINPTTTVLRVFNSANVEVANSSTAAGFAGGTSVGVSAGGYAVWLNAGTVGGQAVDLRAVLVTSTTNGATPDTIRFNQPSAASNDPGFLLQSATGTGTASIQVRWELVLAGTNTPISADISYTIADIDGTGANSAAGALLNAPTRESVVVSTDTLSSFQAAGVTDIKFNTSTPGVVTGFGTVNETASPPLPISAARFNWVNTSNWVITYNLNRAAAAQAGFNHDGNNEFNFGTGGVTTSIPRLDLDANDSTAPGSGASRTFVENSAAISITDTDPLVTNPVGTVQRATVTLTNASLGDVLTVGTLTGGLTATVDTSVAGQVTINITGAATAAQYAAAFQAITYRNTTERPGTADRIINTSYSNGTFSSNVSVSTIRVIEVNDAPTAVNDGPLTTAEDTPITGINVLANDFDGEAVAPTTGDPLTVTTATATNGTVTIGTGGLLTYTPNLNFNGTDTITYTISDGRGGTSTATIPITITAVNDAPTRVGSLPPRANVDAATGINVPTASAFTDVDNATLTYSVANLPLGLSINTTTGVISGTIDRSASQVGGGIYAVVVTARDTAGLTATQSFSWTVTNPAPIASNDPALVVNEDTAGTTVNVLTNDSDPDGDPLAITSASAVNGTVVVNANGTITYTPNLNFNGADTITYSISDGQGGTATATIPVTVTAVNDAPTAVGTLPPRTNVDAASGISVPTAAGFADVDNATLTYSAANLPLGLSINSTTGVISGTIDRSASQVGGGIYNIVVTARDAGNLTTTQSFTWTVTNPGPTAVNDTASTTEDTPIPSINVRANDSDPDGDPLTTTAASAVNGTVTINADGTLRYVPNANFNGTDTITYTISDSQGGTSTATVAVTITAVNDAPTPVGTLPPRTNLDAATGINVATAAAFADVDNATLTYSAANLPLGLTINATTGVISGTIDRSASQGGAGGVYSVIVTARDAGGLTATQTFSWTVTNPPPVAVNDTATTAEDTPVLISVLPNDSDPDGDPLTVISAFSAIGQATIVGNQVRFVPPANFNGTATINYTISDGQGGTSTATITVTVTSVNDAPTATAIAPVATQDGANVSVPVAGNFTDVDGDTLSYTATGLPLGLTINPTTGLISGIIDKAASQTGGGVYSATITVSDGNGGTVTQTISFTVTNPGPVAGNDAASTPEDTAVTIPVLANDRDPDGDTLTVTSAAANNGTVVINPSGTVTYTPNPGFNGTDTITYEISDGNGGTSIARVTVSVADTNDAPTSSTIANQTNLDAQAISLPVSGAFSDPDGDALTYTAVGLPAGLTINAVTGVISGTIDRSASQPNGGVYAITVTASDGRGGSASASFTWTVTNPAPSATNDNVTTNEDTQILIPVLANDRDPDGDTLTVTSAVAGNGTVFINPNGSLSYTPNANFNATDTIFYTISDGEGGLSSATVNITVTPVNDRPTTVGLPNQNGDDGAFVSVPTASAFQDVDGDTLTFSAVGLPPSLTIDPVTGVISGTLSPESSVNGPYTVSVTATDPSGAAITTTFVYSIQNIPPIAMNDTATTPEDTPVRVAVLTNDRDPEGDALTITSASANNGTVVINPDGTLTFTPMLNFNGIATISYTISDGQGGIATATLTVDVTAVNDAPTSLAIPNQVSIDSAFYSANAAPFFSDIDGDTLTFSATGLPAGLTINPTTGVVSGTIDRNASQVNGGVYAVTVTATDPRGATTSQTFTGTVTNPAPTAANDSASTAEDTSVAIPVLTNDIDPDGDPLTVTLATALNGTVSIGAGGVLTYTPNANFNGSDTITYVISDGNGGTSTAAVTVTVTLVNDPPVAVNDSATTNEDTPVTFGLLGNDTDVDGDTLSVTAATSPNGTVVINSDGTITFSPAANFNGPTTITYTISDGNGGTSTATVNIIVDAVNDPPVAVNDVASTPEDTLVNIAVRANDTDVDGDPLTIVSATAINGTVTIRPDGTIDYTPNANFNGTDVITYQISDGKGGFSTATVTVNVGAVNDAPVATPIAPRTNDDTNAVSVSVASNFSDVDGNPLTFSATGLPAGLSISAAGVITGTIDRAASQGGPAADGVYSVTVTASDGNGGTVSQTFSWTVANPAPIAANDIANTSEDTAVIIPVLANDNDTDGDTLTVVSATAPNGTVVINPNGTITYTPNANFNGTDTITYQISDGNGGTSTAIVTVTVAPTNDAPIVDTPLPNARGIDGTAVSIPTANNFSDAERDTLSFVANGLPLGLSINPATGIISGTIERNASQVNGGIYTVAVTASDGKGGSVTTSFTYSVINPAPTATNDSTSTSEDTPVTIPVLANDRDPDGDPLSVTSASAPNGTIVINANGTITYTPNANFNGTDTVTYTISDGNGGTSTATVTVTVAAVNDAPIVDTPIANQANPDADVVSVSVAGNFSDVDRNTLSFTATGLPAGLSINAAGVISGTIDRAASQVNGGVYDVRVTASDGNGGTVTTSFTWTVNNPGPVAVDSTASTAEDTAVVVAVLANDSDPDGDPLTVTSASAPNGAVVINPNGTVTYTPRANFNGTDTITYTISDGNGGTSTATVTVTVTATNDAPTNDAPLANQTNVDADVISIPVAGNFSDLDGNSLSFSATGLPPGLSINAAGIISGTIDRAASQTNGGVYSVVVTASDGNGGTVTSTFTWNVTNPAPTATNDSATTTEDTPTNIAVLANDSDPDGDPLTVTSAAANHGTVVINPDGTITYQPDANFNGTDTIVYTISDGNGGTSTATVAVTVNAVNDAPVTVGLPNLFDSNSEIVNVPFASAFSDVDNATLTYAATGLPGGLFIDPNTGNVVGQVSPTASTAVPGGVYTVTVTATDASGLLVSTTFIWTITNEPPRAINDSYIGAEDTPQVLTVLSNDIDPDSDPTTPIVIVSVNATNGRAVINPDGTIGFTPDRDFNGVATVTYTIQDANGAFATAVATITIAPVNDAPDVTALPDRANQDGVPISIPVGTLFTDKEGDALTFSAGTTLPAGLTIDPATGVISGIIGANASQVNGGVYAVTITATDSGGLSTSSTFIWRITNPGPTAVDDTANTQEDAPVSVAVLANDVDPDGDNRTITTATAPNGSVVINGDGTITYTPDANFNGTDTVTYTISDGQGGTSTATVTITVGALSDAPTVTALPARANLDADPVSLPVASNFADLDGDTLTFSDSGSLPPGLVIDPATGIISGTIDPAASQGGAGGIYTVTITASDGNGGSVSTTFAWTVTNPAPVAADNSATTAEDTLVNINVRGNDSDPDGDPLTVTLASAANGTVTIRADGTLDYTPNTDFNGTDTINYTISDGNGGTATASVTVVVAAGNDAPVVAAIAPRVNVDSAAVSVPVAGNFSDVDGDTLTFSAGGSLPPGLVIDPSTGVISGVINRSTSQGGAGGVYAVTITATDGNGGQVSSTFNWTITNPPPIAVNDSATTPEDFPVNINVLANDSDPDGDPLTVTTASAGNGTVVIRADGSIDYTPNQDFNGSDTVTYTIRDGNGGTSTATITITVGAVNDPPVAVIDTASTSEEAPVTVALLSNDSDLDGDPLTVTAATAPNGSVTINADGTITYTPNRNFNGTDIITYTISDGQGGTSTATVTVIVAPVNDPPVAVNDTASTPEDTPVTIAILGNDSDVDGDSLTVTAATSPDGQVTINADGTITFTPNADFNGSTTISYTISDGKGGTSIANVTLTVSPVNDPPVANPSAAATNEDTLVSLPVLANDSDVDGDPLTVTAASAANGTVTINTDGTVTYTPNANFNGTDTVTYTISDGKGGSATSTVTVTVNPVNDPPVAVNDVATTPEDAPVTIAVLGNDRDLDNDPLTVTAATAPNGTVTVNPDGTINYTPNPDFNGVDVITYTISDGKGGTSTATVTVTVTPLNDAPVATALAPQVNADAAIVSVPLGSNFSDVDNDPLSFSATGLPPGLSIDPATGVISGTIDNSASLAGTYAVSVTASDGKGGSVTQNFSWSITNPVPTAANDFATTPEDTPITVAILANDSDPDGDTLSITAISAANGSVVVNANGTITYTPNLGFSGTDTVTYEISDGEGGTATAKLVIVVDEINDIPVASVIADQNNVDSEAITLPIAAAFSDADGEPLTYVATGLPAGLSLNPTTGVISGTLGNLASQPAGGVYTVTVTASDGRGGSVSTSFTWTVANPVPTATNDVATTAEDTPVNIPVLANDRDPDGDPVTVTAASAGNGSVIINPDGTIQYTPNANFNGTDTIFYTISDGNGGTATASVTVTITPVNDAPTSVGLPNQFDGDAQSVSVPIASAFSDLDTDVLAFSATGLPPGLSLNATTGVISGTLAPNASINGPYIVNVTATDPSGRAVTTGFVWTIQNAPPVANDDVAITAEDTAVIVAVLANDTDPDVDPLRIIAASATNGTVVINGNNTLTYTPTPDFNGTAQVTYTITDGDGGFSTATLTVTVGAVNDRPDARALPPQANLDNQLVSVPVGGFFSDRDGDTLSFVATGLPAGLSINRVTGAITGTIDRAASQPNGGVYLVTVIATDGGGLSVSRTFTWTVTNPGPAATDDSASTREDAPVTIAVLANDSDPDGDPLSVTSATASNGAVTVNSNGSITYLPRPNFSGTDTVTYRIADGNGGFATATVTVTVAPVNDPPVALNDNSATQEDTPVTIGLLANDSDLEGDPLTVTAATAPNGNVVINPDGTITYTPNPGFNGTDVISYTISDGNGGTSAATVTVVIAPVNDLPVAVSDTATTAEDTPVTVPLLSNDSDPDGDPLTVIAAIAPNGSVIINSDGTITYTPNPNFNGVDVITYTVSDGNGGTAIATITVTVRAVNDVPTTSPIAPQVNVDAALIRLPLAGNFSDLDGNALSFIATGLPAGLNINPTTGVISGTIDKAASQPAGGVYAVTVAASDGNGGSVSQTFAWTVSNPAPRAVNDAASTQEDAPVTVAVLANDSDPDGDALTVTTASAPNGGVVINANGTITYTPNPDFNGVDVVTYTINDGNGGTSTATLTIGVGLVNDVPVATAIPNRINLDAASVSVPVAASFSDPDGDPLSFTATGLPNGLSINPVTGLISGTIDKGASQPNGGVYVVTITAADGQGGSVNQTFTWTVTNPVPTAANDSAATQEDTPVTVAVVANDRDPDADALTVTAASAPNGSVVINPDGTITYRPNANFNGGDVITYTISDGNGGTSTATATINIAPVNDAPIANPSAVTTNEDTAVRVPVLANDSDPENNPLTVIAASAPNGTVVINPDGTVTYTPNANFNGVDTITYQISDGKGGTAISTVSVTVTPVNDAPILGNDVSTTPEDEPITIPVLANDRDPDGDPLTITAATSPNGTVVINPDGTITFTPAPNFNGPTTIAYAVSDGKGGTTTATVSLTVSPVNDPPVAVADTGTTNEDTPVRLSPLANDRDVDGNPLTISAASSPNGTVVINPDGTITYTPNPNFSGTDVITYQIRDGRGGFATSTINVTVVPVNDPPRAVNDVANTDEETPVRIPLLANDVDLDGDPLTVTAANAPNGTVVINADGTITYTPRLDYFGTDTITYTVSDGKGGTSTATVTVTVRDTNERPIDLNEAISTVGGVENIINVLANATDPERDPLSVFTAKADVGTVTINPDGTLSYAAPPEFQGVATITYIVSDGRGGFVQSTVTVTVQQATADVNALIGTPKDPGIPDGWRVDSIRDQSDESIEAPLIIDATANSFRSLNPTPNLQGRLPLLNAVNGISWLKGTTDLTGTNHPIDAVHRQLDRIRDLRFGADRLFDPRFGDFIQKSLTGFSVRQLNTGQDQVMIESVVRDRVIYMEVRDIGKDGDPRIVEYQLRSRDGKPLPEWIRMDARGLAIIERPVDADTIRLIVRAIRADGKVFEIPVLVQGATGEIQLDDKVTGKTQIGSAGSLRETMAVASAAVTDEAARLLTAFNGAA